MYISTLSDNYVVRFFDVMHIQPIMQQGVLLKCGMGGPVE